MLEFVTGTAYQCRLKVVFSGGNPQKHTKGKEIKIDTSGHSMKKSTAKSHVKSMVAAKAKEVSKPRATPILKNKFPMEQVQILEGCDH